MDKAALAKRRELATENVRLRKLLADALLANEILKEAADRMGKR